MQIELANSDDIPQLCLLLHTLFSQEVEFKPSHDLQTRGLSLILDNPEIGNIIVARQEQQIVGMVNLLYTVSTALGGRVAILEDMVVDPSARDIGVGTKLLEYCLALAKKNRCKRVTLLTDHDNEGAHRFYHRHGFSRSTMTVFRQKI